MNNVKRAVFKSGMWILCAQALSHLLRLGSNLISTRLLEPSMFGLIALVMVVMQGLAMFTDMGLWSFVVRKGVNITKIELDVVWTVQMLRGWAIFVISFVLSVALFLIQNHTDFLMTKGVYGDELLPILLVVISATVILNGYSTMASAILGRDLKRGRLEIVQLISQLMGAVVMLTWSWYSPSIWALVAGVLAGAASGVIGNYIAFPFRHSLAWDKGVTKDIFNYSKWVMISSILTFFCMQGDRVILANYFTSTQLGVYSVAYLLVSAVMSVMHELSAKMVFPVFCKTVVENKQDIAKVFYKARFIQDAVVFFITGVLTASAGMIVDIMYDERYGDAGWMLGRFALVLPAVALSEVGQECLSALNITKVRAQIMFLRSLGVFVGLPLMYIYYDLDGALWAIVFSYWVGLPCLYFALYKQKIIDYKKEIRMLPLGFIGYGVGLAILALFEGV